MTLLDMTKNPSQLIHEFVRKKSHANYFASKLMIRVNESIIKFETSINQVVYISFFLKKNHMQRWAQETKFCLIY